MSSLGDSRSNRDNRKQGNLSRSMKTIRESYPDGTLPPQNLIHLSCRWNKNI